MLDQSSGLRLAELCRNFEAHFGFRYLHPASLICVPPSNFRLCHLQVLNTQLPPVDANLRNLESPLSVGLNLCTTSTEKLPRKQKRRAEPLRTIMVGHTGPGVKTLSLPVLPNDLLHAPIRWHFDPTLARER